MKMKKIIVVVMVLCVILSHMDSAEAQSPDCYDQCSTACVQSDSKCLSNYICTLFSYGEISTIRQLIITILIKNTVLLGILSFFMKIFYVRKFQSAKISTRSKDLVMQHIDWKPTAHKRLLCSFLSFIYLCIAFCHMQQGLCNVVIASARSSAAQVTSLKSFISPWVKFRKIFSHTR